MKVLLGALLMMSAGCAAVPPAEAEVPEHGGGGSCDAAKAQALVGRARSDEAGAEALRLSGADVLRWLPEGSIVTMEYREGRLNLHLDKANRIVRIACG
jgi:hypothetical protein